MSEIQSLLNRIADLQAEISSLREEENQGNDFVNMVVEGAGISNQACLDKQWRRNKFYAVGSESTFAYSLGDNVNSNYGQVRQDNIQYCFDEIIRKAQRRISDIEEEIGYLNNEISNCNSRIEAIRAEEERKRKECLGY